MLHTIFWRNLSPDGGDRPDGSLADAITEHLGSFDAFAGQLTAATTSVQGSGWGVLAWEPLSRRLIVEQVDDHHGNVGMGSTPLLVFDAWEQAYYLQYRNVRPDYVDRLWGLVAWADVQRRFDLAVAARAPWSCRDGGRARDAGRDRRPPRRGGPHRRRGPCGPRPR